MKNNNNNLPIPEQTLEIKRKALMAEVNDWWQKKDHFEL